METESKSKRRTFDEAFKRDAVALLSKGDQPIKQLAQNLGVSQWNLRDWSAYQRAARAGESTVAGQEQLGSAAVALEEIYLGLRTSDGLPVHRIAPAAREHWEREGWAQSSQGRVRLTAEGWLRLDALAASVSE